jgi:uncharacterized protein (TIGR02594 family)
MLASVVEEFPWMPIALHEMGVKETPGAGNNPRVVAYLRSTSLDADQAAQDATPWCSAFVNWCVEGCGIPGTNSAAARSWLTWGRAVAVPRRGCIAVFSRGTGGHVAFYVGMSTALAQILVLGGNQTDCVCISGYEKSRLLGYRLPLSSSAGAGGGRSAAHGGKAAAG